MAQGLKTNLVAGMFSHLLRFAAPLVAYPFLTRALGTDGFSQFSLIMAAGLILSQFIEYGFGLMSVRNISQKEGDAAIICGSIILGRLVTFAATAICYIVVVPFIPIAELHSAGAIFGTLLLASAYGFSSSWYFIGIERAVALAGQEIAAALATLCLIILLIKSPDDGALAICLFALPLWVAVLYGHFRAVRDFGFRLPSAGAFAASFAKSSHFFVLTATGPIINRLSVIALGVFSTPAQVAYYAAGDRMISAAINASLPLVRILIPRVSSLLRTNPAAAKKLFVKTSTVVVVVFTAASLITVALAPWLVPLVFGAAMSDATSIVILQLFIIPLAVCSRCCGMLALVPLHEERRYKNMTLLTGVLGLVLLPFVAGPYGGAGVAGVRILTEGALAIFCLWIVLRLRGAWVSKTTL